MKVECTCEKMPHGSAAVSLAVCTPIIDGEASPENIQSSVCDSSNHFWFYADQMSKAHSRMELYLLANLIARLVVENLLFGNSETPPKQLYLLANRCW